MIGIPNLIQPYRDNHNDRAPTSSTTQTVKREALLPYRINLLNHKAVETSIVSKALDPYTNSR